MKRKILISFSGGETSGFMAQWCKNHYINDELVFVFANTGEENEETLRFVDQCDKLFNLHLVWVEALVDSEMGIGTTYKIVDFETASRNGEPFEQVIAKYGIPNLKFPHCNRELKLRPIHSYIKSLGWKDYYTCIGIRNDEIDRVSKDRKKNKILYPLVSEVPMTKAKINFWWSQQPFRLNLTGYQGNCKTCWKKSFNNLYTIANENPQYFEFNQRMEDKYSNMIIKDRTNNADNYTFFRGGKSTKQILDEAKNFNKKVKDANENVNYQMDIYDIINDEQSSCDIYAECGLDN